MRFWRALRFCAVRFACKVPTWRLPAAGNVAGLVTEGGEEVGVVHVAPLAHASSSIRALGLDCLGVGIRVLGDQPRPRIWKRLRVSVSSLGLDDDAGGRQLHDHLQGGALVQDREMAERHCG